MSNSNTESPVIDQKVLLVTGGAGFIGSHFVEKAVERGHKVVVLDALTYAGHEANLEHIKGPGSFQLVVGNICDQSLIAKILDEHQVSQIVNFAAESHVDRSISGPGEFIQTNVVGTFSLLNVALSYWSKLNESKKNQFRYLQVSTDEVFGELGEEGYFTEKTPYDPRSPYSASKAAADHLVRAWHATYGLPTLITNCSNNYGPRQYPEKLIPVLTLKAAHQQPLPVYGRGLNIRDWIHVQDHCEGIWLALTKGKIGESYCFGGNSERKNIDVAHAVCRILDEIKPLSGGKKYDHLISFVSDRLGHDFRYAIDDSRAIQELGFKRKYQSFEEGLSETVKWYLDHQDWCTRVRKK